METKEMDAEMTEAAATTDPILEEKLKDHKVETRMVVDEELLLAYCYFDKNKVGYLKSDDIRRLLHSLGMFLSHRIVKELVVSAVLESNKSARNDHITYRCFTEKEVEVDTTLAAG
jgi:Ca2+-binding EF-hand superfamily protein